MSHTVLILVTGLRLSQQPPEEQETENLELRTTHIPKKSEPPYWIVNEHLKLRLFSLTSEKMRATTEGGNGESHILLSTFHTCNKDQRSAHLTESESPKSMLGWYISSHESPSVVHHSNDPREIRDHRLVRANAKNRS